MAVGLAGAVLEQRGERGDEEGRAVDERFGALRY